MRMDAAAMRVRVDANAGGYGYILHGSDTVPWVLGRFVVASVRHETPWLVYNLFSPAISHTLNSG